MKVCIIGDVTQANMERFISDAFINLGWETVIIETGKGLNFPYNKVISKYLLGAIFIKNYYDVPYLNKLNHDTIQKILELKPDLIVSHDNAKLSSDTILSIRKKLNIPFVCLAADDPTLAYGQVNYLEAIFGYSHIIALDSSIVQRIKAFSNTNVHYITGGTNINFYYPFEERNENDEIVYRSNISYCSASYQGNAMGLYRGAILSNLSEYGLKIYGDKHWERIAKVFPNLKSSIDKNGYLTAEEVNKVYNYTSIYISIVNPLLLAGISQRVFDCGAAGCFQIAEWKQDIENAFPNNEIETYKTIPELKEKVKWYLDNPSEREKKSESAYKIITTKYQWTDFVRNILGILN